MVLPRNVAADTGVMDHGTRIANTLAIRTTVFIADLMPEPFRQKPAYQSTSLT
jgi:hypothetical protein